jgi:EpsI family protein
MKTIENKCVERICRQYLTLSADSPAGQDLPGEVLSRLGFISKKRCAQVGFLIIVLLFCYAPVFTELIKTWWSEKAYSHGFLIIPISLYLSWVGRAKLISLKPKPSRLSGISIMILAGIMLLAGNAGSVPLLQELSLIVIVTGLVMLLLGVKYLKALALPIAYLLFMVPRLDKLDVVSYRIHWPLQLFSAKLGVLMLQFFGYVAYLQNQYIELPRLTLEVAEGCSGLRYLVSVIAIGIPLAYLTQKSWIRRVVLVGSAVIIAILANGLRVMFVGIVAYHGNTNIHGPFHIFHGILVSWVGFIVLFAGTWLLSTIPYDSQKVSLNSKSTAKHPEQESNYQFDRLWLIATVILLVNICLFYLPKPTPVPWNENLNSILLANGEWEERHGHVGSQLFRIQGADREIFREHHGATGQEINLYIGYFQSQRQDKKLVSYSSKELHENAIEVIVPISSQLSLYANKTILKKRGADYLVLFWYDINGRIVSNQFWAQFLIIYDALIHGHSNGAIIMLFGPPEQSSRLEKTFEYEQTLIRSLIPIIQKHLNRA